MILEAEKSNSMVLALLDLVWAILLNTTWWRVSHGKTEQA
jgi:hypothetical protein